MKNLNFCLLIILSLAIFSNVSASNITYSDITQPSYEDVSVFISIASLKHLFVMSRQFVDVVFKPFSHIEEFLFDLITTVTEDNSDFIQELQDQWQTLASFEVGYMVCLVFGLLFVLVSVVGGLVMCCCRTCCGNCGGEMVQTKRRVQSKWRHCLCGSFFVVIAFITVPMVFVFLTNEWVTDVVRELPVKTNKTFGDLTTYINSLPVQFEEVVSQYEVLDASLRNDVTTLNESLGVPIQTQFETIAQPAVDALRAISDDTNSALSALQVVQNSTIEIQAGLSSLDASLTAEQTSLSNDLNNTNCTNNFYCNNVFLSAADLTLGGDFSSLDSVSDEITEIENIVNANDIEAGISTAEQQLEGIPSLVADSSSDATDELLSTLDGVKATIDDIVFPTDSIDDITEQIVNAQNSFNDLYDSYSSNFEKYRYIAGLVLGSTLAVVCACYWVGLVLGVVTYKEQKMASKRSCLSNCGGLLIMAGVGFSFLFAWLLMLLVVVTFTLGGHGERYVCQTLEAPYEGLKFADRFIEPVSISGTELNISVTEVLTVNCKNNASIYTALQLENLYNVTAIYENLTSNLDDFQSDLSGFQVNISVDLYTPEIEDSLNALKSTGLDGINFDSYIDAASEGLTKVNLVEYAQFLNDSADNITGSAVLYAEVIRGHSYAILQIQASQVDPLLPAVDELNSNIVELQNISDGLNDTVDNTASVLNETDQRIETEGSQFVEDEVRAFSDAIITDVTGYGDWFLEQITENFGICYPVYIIYTQTVSILCDYLIDILNGLWFCIGWCVFFMIPGAVLGMKLAKFYRRMAADDEDFGNHWNDMEMDPFNRSNNNGNGQRSSGKFSFNHSKRSAKIHPGEYY